MLNRKFAEPRHSPKLDPRVLSYVAVALPHAVVAIGPLAQRTTRWGLAPSRQPGGSTEHLTK